MRSVLQRRLADLQAVADQRQADLLADLMGGAAVQPSGSRSKVRLVDLGDAHVVGSRSKVTYLVDLGDAHVAGSRSKVTYLVADLGGSGLYATGCPSG